ncbi:hypothetical protein ACRALDRAFT_2101932 [Sodiomyces alcalophilus JCM 7366]|uniref:uncharacterized protein n=1 Tax=Sodiomyces alcalophilus JCM 7366 TaxID=591952 RepID=UPI0039B50B9E
MEPIPQSESLEQFHASHIPSLHLQNDPASPVESQTPSKPSRTRHSTAAGPSFPGFSWTPPPLPYRSRTTSPVLRTHTRSRSAVSLTQGMSRVQPMPGFTGSANIMHSPQRRPASACGSPSRARAQRHTVDEAFPISPARKSILEKDRKDLILSSSPTHATIGPSTASACYRRPSSPFRNATHAIVVLMPSPPAYLTPTSARSRSPSISSLETIPDSPDAEEAALELEAERIAQLQDTPKDAETGQPSADSKWRGTCEVPTRSRTLGFGNRDKRKRWSVCGAERRGDIDLETIWED